MTEPLKGLEHKVEGLEHKVEEKVEDLAHEAEEGQSARTPLLVVSGVAIFVAVIVAILLVLSFTAYYLTK
ncbi:MAG TPA: hypothetical protein VH210_07070 [Gaiellaceae bacterium]|jgi:hypothetical protein|nr:hypothetical protein [Gaiellaceae bacterium]